MTSTKSTPSKKAVKPAAKPAPQAPAKEVQPITGPHRVNTYAATVQVDKVTHGGQTLKDKHKAVVSIQAPTNAPVDHDLVNESILEAVNAQHELALTLDDAAVSIEYRLVDTYITKGE